MEDESRRILLSDGTEAIISASASIVPFHSLASSWSVQRNLRVGKEGDAVLVAVSDLNRARRISLQNASGRVISLYRGDRFVGILGVRQSTGQIPGYLPKEPIGFSSSLHLLSEGGVVGIADASAPTTSSLIPLNCIGFLIQDLELLNLSRFGLGPTTPCALPPIFLVAGTSTGIGKTSLACRIIHTLARQGVGRIASIMFSGSGGKEDTLAHRSAGAHVFHSFIETGLCNSYGCPPQRYVSLMDQLCFQIARTEKPDVIIGELGGDLVWGNNDALFQHAKFMHAVAGLFVVCHDTLGAIGATQILDTWGVNAPRHYVVSWTQNLAAMRPRFERWLHIDLIDPNNDDHLAHLLHTCFSRKFKPSVGEVHA